MATKPRRSSGKAQQAKARGPHDPSEGQATAAPKPKRPTRSPAAKPAAQATPGGAAASKKPAYALNRITAADEAHPIAERIANGESYRVIAADLGVSAGWLTYWIAAEPERAQACARAREQAAQVFDEMAESRLDTAADPFELAKARELAVHYRWRAKAVNPRQYGDKTTVEGNPDNPVAHSIVVKFVEPSK